MIRIGKSAQMLCARDNFSLEHLKELGLDNARLFPDITFALETTGFDQSTMGCSKYGCLIINNKLISSGNMNSKEVIELFHKAKLHGDKLIVIVNNDKQREMNS